MDYIFVKKDKINVKINITDILYIGTIENRPRVLEFVTDKETYQSYGQLKAIEAMTALSLKRCHRKYLVNLRRIKAIDSLNRQIIFDNPFISPIDCSRRNMKGILREWKK
ncbi:LytTR family DNA-binding domain-containing protein [Streptococcus pacificus]|uniref:LytTR family transcriptional regulator DNA-binding domain-containing protein n=1 Tax=Streptococcus pacificus TaxID=2740577 RepID=A0ABS0ZKB3_9STRE|nr:LytTR family DNA-binding domain-containing protein [Streptococcus pacificus]MBJ8326465.1 LytTR family transcriptional regulator DNA-binding domain-containing protein [Streptococcus pacificus]